jgi:hypothetical protein
MGIEGGRRCPLLNKLLRTHGLALLSTHPWCCSAWLPHHAPDRVVGLLPEVSWLGPGRASCRRKGLLVSFHAMRRRRRSARRGCAGALRVEVYRRTEVNVGDVVVGRFVMKTGHWRWRLAPADSLKHSGSRSFYGCRCVGRLSCACIVRAGGRVYITIVAALFAVLAVYLLFWQRPCTSLIVKATGAAVCTVLSMYS